MYSLMSSIVIVAVESDSFIISSEDKGNLLCCLKHASNKSTFSMCT